MLERAHAPIDPAAQAVLFYLYAQDLDGLRAHLLGAGVSAGEIVDGSPGPEREMRVVDPDGYVLMIAESEGEPVRRGCRARPRRPGPRAGRRRRRCRARG